MNDPTIHADAHPAPAACENCSAPLQGEYCHACGQSVHNPIRHFGHAIEEFFEAFWHLDGRVFRTLRDLQVPGRVAVGYIAGHRARYIAPLRMFVVLSVLTFFIGSAAVHVEGEAMEVSGIEEIEAAATVEDVQRIRDGLVAEFRRDQAEDAGTPGVDAILAAAEARVHAAAASRIEELGGAGADGGDPQGVTPPAGERPAVRSTDPSPSRLQFNTLGHRGYWHPEDNPVVISWWPGFANDWLNRKVGNLEKNLQALQDSSADAWLQAAMSAAPTALFLLVPVFALLLKIAYVFTPRLYLEHLVVALYSHAFLLVMAMVAFVLKAVGDWAEATLLGPVFDLAIWAIVIWMPVYLLLMQRRAYGQAWWLTILKYAVIGYVYFWLLGIATLLIFLGQLTAA